jgi:RNA polymerase sigma factor (sigma-70 family)
MLLRLNGIGNQKISYKDHKTIEFDSLDSYLLLAKKAISKFANKICNGLSIKMLKDEDAISDVANAIMMADWRWDENYKNQAGTKKTKYSYRNQCAIWAIQTHISKSYKTPKKINKVYSLDHQHDIENMPSIHECIQDNKTLPPDEILTLKEKETNLKILIDSLLNLDCLSDRQKDYIRLYYFENYTFEKIGQKYGITREAVRQGLNKALNIIRELGCLKSN